MTSTPAGALTRPISQAGLRRREREPVPVVGAAQIAAHATRRRAAASRPPASRWARAPSRAAGGPQRAVSVYGSSAFAVGGVPVDPDLAHRQVRLRRPDRRRLQPFARAAPARVALGDAPPLRVEQLQHQVDAGDPFQPRVHRARSLARAGIAEVVDVAFADRSAARRSLPRTGASDASRFAYPAVLLGSRSRPSPRVRTAAPKHERAARRRRPTRPAG